MRLSGKSLDWFRKTVASEISLSSFAEASFVVPHKQIEGPHRLSTSADCHVLFHPIAPTQQLWTWKFICDNQHGMVNGYCPADVISRLSNLPRQSIVLIGLMGSGKTSVGRRLAIRLGMPFRDADDEIEHAAGCSISEIFSRFGEEAFRDGERRVIRRLLSEPPSVIAFGGGAFIDLETRMLTRSRATSVWLKCPLDTIVTRVSNRYDRPLLNGVDQKSTLLRLMMARDPIYGEADVTVNCGDGPPEATVSEVISELVNYRLSRRVTVSSSIRTYEVVIGKGLLDRIGSLLAPILPSKRVVVVGDRKVASIHSEKVRGSLSYSGFVNSLITVEGGESSKNICEWSGLVEKIIEQNPDRGTTIIALGGGVIGDLAGFAAAVTLRGLPFVQIPTTLLAQVDSSVGGKTGVNTPRGKNLVGSFYQPWIVVADVGTLSTLPLRELRAGYAEIVKVGLIGDRSFFAWCERNGLKILSGDTNSQVEAVWNSCSFKANIVENDEREEKADGGRGLLNLGHTFAHALEAEYGLGGCILHGEAVAIGLGLAFELSGRLGFCNPTEVERVLEHIKSVGLPSKIRSLDRKFSAERLLNHMKRDKKARDNKLTFVLARAIGEAFLKSDVPEDTVRQLLREEGCSI